MLALVVIFLLFNIAIFFVDDNKRYVSFVSIFCVLSCVLYYILFYFALSQELINFDNYTSICFFILIAFMNFFVKIGASYPFSKKNSSYGVFLLNEKDDFLLYRLAWLLLGISFISVYLFTKCYGGFSNYVEYEALALRAGVSLVHNPWSFLQPFCRFSTISFLIFLAILLKRTVSLNKKIVFIGISLAAYACWLSFVGDKARLALVCFVLVFVFSILDVKIHSESKRLAVKISLIVVATMLAQVVSEFLGRGAQEGNNKTLARGVLFVFSNFDYWFNNLTIDKLRFFVDYIISPLYLLPSKVLVLLDIHYASSVNTYYQLGAFKGTQSVTGELPLDFLTCAYAQLGAFGIAVVSFVWGKILATLDSVVEAVNDVAYKKVLFNYIAIELVFRSILNGDPKSIVMRVFPAVFFVFLFFLGRFFRGRGR